MNSIIRILYQSGVTIYGAGYRGHCAAEWLRTRSIPIQAVIDRDVKKIDGSFEGETIISVENAKKKLSRDSIILITPMCDCTAETEILKQHFECVFDWRFLDWIDSFINYYIPDNLDIMGEMNYSWARPFNHYSSPYVSAQDIKYWDRMTQLDQRTDIDLNDIEQIEFIENLHVKEFKAINNRYYPDNDFFAGYDGVVYCEMLLKYKPKRIIEIGSGFSTALALDVNEKYLDNKMRITCIEPYADRLKSLISDKDNVEIKEQYLQEVDLNIFSELERNDILFIDSSHILKPGSDVLYEMFLILPLLKEGVIIHIHDICSYFDYPKPWGGWGHPVNEAYAYRAFLSGNNNYKIILFVHMQTERIRKRWEETGVPYNPDDIRGAGGSLWIQKIGG